MLSGNVEICALLVIVLANNVNNASAAVHNLSSPYDNQSDQTKLSCTKVTGCNDIMAMISSK